MSDTLFYVPALEHTLSLHVHMDILPHLWNGNHQHDHSGPFLKLRKKKNFANYIKIKKIKLDFLQHLKSDQLFEASLMKLNA